MEQYCVSYGTLFPSSREVDGNDVEARADWFEYGTRPFAEGGIVMFGA